MKKSITILALLLAAFTNVLFGQQPGDLDVTFDDDGRVTTDFGGKETISNIAIQPGGKIVVAGYRDSESALARYHNDGRLDFNFGASGIIVGEIYGPNISYSVAIQPDGKIVTAGATGLFVSDISVARFHSDGTPDTTFGTGGKVVLTYSPGTFRNIFVAIQSDGRIVAAVTLTELDSSSSQILLFRYDLNGTYDGINTVVIDTHTVVRSIAVQPDDKIVVAGSAGDGTESDFAIARFRSDSGLDNSFSTDGWTRLDFDEKFDEAWGVAIQPDGKIVAAGIIDDESHFGLARFNTDGNPDNSFDSDGKVETDFDGVSGARSVIVQPDGKIVAAGYADFAGGSDFALARYNEDGSLDNSFGAGGKINTNLGINSTVGALVLQPDGKIVAAGLVVSPGSDYNFGLARYISGLNVRILELSYAENMLVYPNPVQDTEILEYTLQDDERISIALHDISGKLIRCFITDEFRGKGFHRETLNFDETLSSGNYVLRISSTQGSAQIQIIK